MSGNDNGPESTRRDYVKYGGTVLTGGLLAGCMGDTDASSTPTTNASETTTESTATGSTEAESDDSGYSATISPVGEVEFESVPENVFTILSHHTDMALALGYGDNINAMHAPGYIQSLWSKFTHHLDGVSVDWDGLYSSWPPTKEKLYELDSDVHLADPARVATAEGWDESDIEEIKENVAPWFGNTFSDAHQQPPAAWQDGYEYYTLWETFGRVAQVFQEEERYKALADVHNSLLTTIEANLPPESERPSAAMVLFSSSDDSMWGYKTNAPGYYASHTRPLGATDALTEAVGDSYENVGDDITLDYETLLEADPDVLLVLGPMTEYHNIDDIRAKLEDHDVAKKITAVEEGQVYVQGTRRQGPLLNLFQLEMTAKQLYPDQFGEWPGYTNGEPYPEIPTDEQLFDRQRVADIVSGDN
ncbi:ABC transporter substrate-binding protein [Halogeometricum borinquense]|uniref:ABC transporter substrate-binding protein n=1 Tax=Halogeometricum borinquense TaxID=60847 RepID=UPI001A937E29|nr:ABC transporter substrate-binding protein [Halogeometricum borinquense]